MTDPPPVVHLTDGAAVTGPALCGRGPVLPAPGGPWRICWDCRRIAGLPLW